MHTIVAIALGALLVLGLGAAPLGAADSSGELVAIGSVEELAEAFNADQGNPRLVLLLSPT